MPESRLTETNETSTIPAFIQPEPSRETLRILLIGSRQGVTNTIHTLYNRGFAQVSEWSPLLPAPNPGEVMSILSRSIAIS